MSAQPGQPELSLLEQLTPERCLNWTQAYLDAGKFKEALVAHRLAKLLAAPPDVPNFISKDFIARICDYREWSERNGFQYYAQPVENAFKEHSYLASMPSYLTALYRRFYQEHHAAYLVEARNITIVNWAFRNYDEHFALFSAKGDYLWPAQYTGVDPFYLPFIQGKCYLRFHSQDRTHALIDLGVCAPNVQSYDRQCIFLGSRQNYGHWLQDFITKFSVMEQFPELRRLPLVVGNLRDFHREVLTLLKEDRELIEVFPQENRPGVLCKLTNAFVPSALPTPTGKEYLRRRFVAAVREPVGNQYARVFASRRNLHPRHRIENEDEVCDLLRKRGFAIVYPEKLSVYETVKIFMNAKIILTPLGTQGHNIVFADKFVMIQLIPDIVGSLGEIWWRSLSDTVFPVVEKYIPVWGKVVGTGEVPWDVPAIYDVQKINNAIDQAEEMLTKL